MPRFQHEGLPHCSCCLSVGGQTLHPDMQLGEHAFLGPSSGTASTAITALLLILHLSPLRKCWPRSSGTQCDSEPGTEQDREQGSIHTQRTTA